MVTSCEGDLWPALLKSKSSAAYFSISIVVTPCNQDLIKEVAVVVIPARSGRLRCDDGIFLGMTGFLPPGDEYGCRGTTAGERQARISLGHSNDKLESTSELCRSTCWCSSPVKLTLRARECKYMQLLITNHYQDSPE